MRLCSLLPSRDRRRVSKSETVTVKPYSMPRRSGTRFAARLPGGGPG
jgi:hypothetical protein